MTQDELASEIGVKQAAVSQWEKGVRVPDIEMLSRLAVALDVLPLTLVDESVATTTPMFRASGVERKKDEKMIEGRTELARLAASRLLAEVEMTVTLPWPTEKDPLGDDPEDAAAALRRVWRIPPGPIANLTKLVEAAGAVVLRVAFGHPGVEAAYAHPRRAATRWLVLNTFLDDWARMRITIAHELGHAMLHHWDAFNVPDERERERQAYRFALALMVPADDFILDIAHTQRRWDDFLRLRHKWGISAAALARRAHDLKLIDPKAYKAINIERRKRGHWKLEPGDDAPIERPKVFPAAVELLRDEAGWTPEAFAETAGLPYARLSDLFPDDFAPTAPDVAFRLRRVK